MPGRWTRGLLVAGFALGISGAAQGGTIALAFDGPTFGFSTQFTQGWEFVADQNLSVTKLGVFDHLADGLVNAHEVGLWTQSGTLLGSVTIQAGTASRLEGPVSGSGSGGRFRWETLSTPIPLSKGETYVLGAFYQNAMDPLYTNVTATTVPEITYVVGRVVGGASLTFPSIPSPSSLDSKFGPNFQFAPPAPFLGPLGLAMLGSLLGLSAYTARIARLRRF